MIQQSTPILAGGWMGFYLYLKNSRQDIHTPTVSGNYMLHGEDNEGLGFTGIHLKHSCQGSINTSFFPLRPSYSIYSVADKIEPDPSI